MEIRDVHVEGRGAGLFFLLAFKFARFDSILESSIAKALF